MHIKDAIANLFTGHSASRRSDKAHAQTQAAPKRVAPGSATKPPSLAAHRIQTPPASPVRVQVREALAAADQKLSDVFAAVLLGPQKHVQHYLGELVAALMPLSENIAKEVDMTGIQDPKEEHEKNTAIAMFDVIGTLAANKLGKMSAKELDMLGNSVQALPQNDPNRDSLINFLAAAIKAADLVLQVKAFEADAQVSGTSKQSDVGQLPLAALRDLNDMGKIAGDLTNFFNAPLRGKTYSGTQLTQKRLQATQDRGIAANAELKRREGRLIFAGGTASLKTLQRGELMKLNASVTDWLEAFPSDAAMKAIQNNVQERLMSLDADITKSVLGTADAFNLKTLSGLTGKGLLRLKIKMAEQGYLPPALVNAQGMVLGEIALRKTSAQVKFVEALTAATQETDADAMGAKLLACASVLNASRLVLTNLGDELKPETMSEWIGRALRYVDVKTLEGVQEIVTKRLQSKPFQQAVMAHDTPQGKLLAEYLRQLSNHLDALMKGSRAPRRG